MASREIEYKENLVPRIRDLIDGYSKNSILKEYLQNADDSGATELIVTYDKRIHKSLDKTDYEAAKGSSLLLYNDSIFKEKDFESIVEISYQGKSVDANSTGRFGQGFSSSFSISDHPSFVSNGRAYWFDVLKKAVSHKNKSSIQFWEEGGFAEIEEWLNTFSASNQVRNEFKGTIFRLPLRDENTATESEISHEIFTLDDFLEWCDEWKDNADSLLFLRHVHKLVLQEIDADGNLIIHLEIRTENAEEINYNNNCIKNELNGTPLDICNNWKLHGNDLPLFKYHHKFNISYLDREENIHKTTQEIWAVVNGLFRGENDSLIDQAIKVLNISPNPRKVLPWAGVALALDNDNKPLKQRNSKFYTFLPLPIESSHPVHVHAWFDLNPKRTEITKDGAGEDKEILIQWNQCLMKDAVGMAWALLVDFIKDENNFGIYYDLWAGKKKEGELDKCLIEGFYKKITELECFYSLFKNEKKWVKPTEKIYFFKAEKHEILLDAFKEHFQIICPEPKKYILDNLTNINVKLGEINPEFIRKTLEEKSKDIKFPIELSKMPIAMIAQKEWFLEVLKYCADEGKDYTKLDNLPLELTLDQKIYRVGVDTLFDENPDIELFQDLKYLFLDINLIQSILNIDLLPSTWLHPIFKNTIAILTANFDSIKLDKNWIQYFIIFISRVKDEEINGSIDDLKTLKVVYQEDGNYACLESDIEKNSPFIIKKEDINNIKYLQEIGINLVHTDYIDVYNPILKHNCFITKLSSESLAKHLLILNDYSFFKDVDTREFLIDLLADDISWYEELDDDEDEKFLSIPFIQTESDNLYTLSTDKKLFLPTKFEPPKHIKNLSGEYELISCIGSKQFSMYKKMGIEERTSINYLKDVIIPFIENSSEIEDRNNVLKWMAIEWENLTKDIEVKAKEDLIQRLRNAKIIPNKHNGDLEKAEKYYHPSFSASLQPIFRDDKFNPVNFDDKKDQEKWADFLTILNASTAILAQHIVSIVDKIIEKNNYNDAILLLNYISNEFERFEEMYYEDQPILDYLKKLAWYPAEKRQDILKPDDKYTLLKTSEKLILSDDIKIAGGVYDILSKEVKLGKKDAQGEYTKKQMAKSLGILINLPIESIFTSFKKLTKIYIHDKQKRNKVLNYAKNFYEYLGKQDATYIPDDIKEKSILIHDKWVSSKNVFQQKINLTGIFDWSPIVGHEKESSLAEGLKKLGVKEKPDIAFLIEQLKNIPVDKKLEKHRLKDAKAILNELKENIEELQSEFFCKHYELPLLSKNDQLVLCSSIYIDDLPAYKTAKEKNEDLNFCQSQFEKLAHSFGVISLVEKVKPVLNCNDSEFIPSEKSNNYWVDEYIKTISFKRAVLRLNFHEGKIEEKDINLDSLESILPSKIQFSRKLIIDYKINDVWVYKDTDASTYIHEEVLYILDQGDVEDMCECVSKYICKAKGLSQDTAFHICRILKNKMNEVKIKDFLDKKNIKALPENPDIEDYCSIYNYDHSEQDNGYFETLITHESLDDEDEIISIVKSKESLDLDDNSSFLNSDTDENDSTIPNNENKSNGEVIPPPINPKFSTEREREEVTTGNPYDTSRSYTGNHRNTGNYPKNNSGTRNIVSSNDRKPVYVGKDKDVDTNTESNQKERATEIGIKGENYILSNSKNALLSENNYFEKAPVNNEGFDIYEKDSIGNIVRYIEVKTLTGQWGQGGVGITEPQLKFAQNNNNWWLFVVENINTDSTKIYQFQNPILEANRFMFDNSWKQLAYKFNDVIEIMPKIGDLYDIGEDDNIYEVLSVEPKGKFFLVKLRADNYSKTIQKKFNPSWKKQQWQI